MEIMSKNQIEIAKLKSTTEARHCWLMPIILATQEAEIRRIRFEASPGK
jgi:hypothetical protein